MSRAPGGLMTALVAFCALAPILSTSGAQSLGQADLALAALDVGSPAVGAPRPLTATVRNDGPATALGFTVTFYRNQPDNPVAGAEQASRASGSGPLAPGQSATVTLAWTPTEDQAGAAVIIAVVRAGGSVADPNGANDRADRSTFVTLPGVQVAPTWGADPIAVEPGAEHPFPFTVANTGNAQGTYAARLTQPTAEGWTLRVAPDRVRLLPGERAEFVLTAQPPANADAGKAVNASNGLALTVEQEGYTDSVRGVAAPPAPSIVVAPRRALVLDVSEVEPRNPRESVSGGLVVQNSGNTDETVSLTRSDTQGSAPRWWPLTFTSDEVDVGAFSSTTTAFQLDLPSNATAGAYRLALVATGQGGTAPPVATALVPVTVLQIHALDATVARAGLRLLPGQPGVFHGNVTNVGNGNDTIALAWTSPGEGWTVDASPNNVSVGPNETRPLTLTVSPPAGTAPQTGRRIELSLTTGDGEARATRTIPLTVDVVAGPNVRLAGVPTAPKADPATGLTLTMRVENAGNRAGNATIETHAAPGWRVTRNLDAVTDLAPGDSRAFRLTVLPPEGARPGDAADVVVRIANEDGGPAVEETLDVVVGGPDLAVRIERAPERVSAGHVVELGVHVDSAGLEGAPATRVMLIAQGSKGVETLGSWEIGSLPTGAGERRSTVWNTTGWSGTVALTARIDPDNTVVEEDETNNEGSRALFVVTSLIEITVPPPLTVDPGQRVRLATAPLGIQVANRGNDRALVAVRVADEGGWLRHETTAELAAGAAQAIPLDLVVPRPTGRISNNVTVSAASQGVGSAPATARWTISVRDLAPPLVERIDLTDTPEWGVRLVHDIAWDDGSGVRGGKIAITADDGNTTEVPVTVEGGRARFAWRPSALGNHSLVVTLEDLAGNSGPSRAFTAGVGAPLPPGVETPRDVRVAPGAQIPVRIASVAPVASVVVEAAGLRGALVAPYRINTTGWSEGDHLVRVNVTDELGRSAEATFTATVDATPPGLVDARADPRRPGGGADVEVRLTFDEPVTNASLLLVTGEGRRIPKALTQVSSTVWEGSFAMPGERVERADVQATDVAGNEALVEGAVDVRTDRLIPAPSAILVLVVLALYAVGAQRIRHR